MIFAVVKRTMKKRDTFYVLLCKEDIPFKRGATHFVDHTYEKFTLTRCHKKVLQRKRIN